MASAKQKSTAKQQKSVAEKTAGIKNTASKKGKSTTDKSLVKHAARSIKPAASQEPQKKKMAVNKIGSASKAKTAQISKTAVTVSRENAAPSKSERKMDIPAADRFRELKSMLLAKRDSILRESKQEIVKYISGENRQLVDTAIDEADWAAVDISEDINLKRLAAHKQLLVDIEECLRKIKEGTYGVCEDCGEEISGKRLNVIPTASLCIDCKEIRERMAAFEQDSDM